MLKTATRSEEATSSSRPQLKTIKNDLKTSGFRKCLGYSGAIFGKITSDFRDMDIFQYEHMLIDLLRGRRISMETIENLASDVLTLRDSLLAGEFEELYRDAEDQGFWESEQIYVNFVESAFKEIVGRKKESPVNLWGVYQAERASVYDGHISDKALCRRAYNKIKAGEYLSL